MSLYAYASNELCQYTHHYQTVTAAGSGQFVADFSSQADFDRRGYAYVYARDANGNSTYGYFDAYHVSATFGSSSYSGALRPFATFTATLRRGSSVVATDDGQADGRGRFSGAFSGAIRPGDVVTINGTGVNFALTAAPLDVVVNPTTNQATGTTTPGRRVRGSISKRNEYDLATTCDERSACVGAQASASGAFTLAAPAIDLVPGDYVSLMVYDAEGNYQYAYPAAPVLVANLTWNEALGYWSLSDARLTVTLRDSHGAVKEVRTDVYISPYGGDFYAYFSPATIVPGDRLDVTDGTTTRSMTVQNLTATLNNTTERLSGNAPNGHLVANLDDFRRGEEYGYDCKEMDVSGGAYSLDLSLIHISEPTRPY